MTGGAGAIGPVASGWLLGHFWYGSVFLVNVPIILVALVAGAFLVPKSKDPQEAQLDLVGAGPLDRRHLVARLRTDRGARQGMVEHVDDSGAFAISSRRAHGVRAVGEARRTTRCSTWRTSATRPSAPATGGMILVFLSMFGVMFLITQYFQLVLGYSPLSAALRLLADGADHDDRVAAHAADRRARSAPTAPWPSA